MTMWPNHALRVRSALGGAAILLAAGCAAPAPRDSTPDHLTRLIEQNHGPIAVRAVALGRDETRAALGLDLTELDIQPVWIEVDNDHHEGFWLFPHAVDEDYFPPYEAARRAAQFSLESTHALYARLDAAQIPFFVAPGESVRGFVYARDDEGAKAFSVELHGPGRQRLSFHFLSPVPGLPTDYLEAPHDLLADPTAPALDDDGLRRWIETEAPATTRAADGTPGDPINIALVGSLEGVRDALISSGWDATAPITAGSLQRVAGAFLFGGRYRYAPVSDLYVFDRAQDLAFQRARPTIVERNHMRLWLAPVRHEGRPVWLGQVSRDDGVKFSGRVWPPTTHVIDPDVDEARFFLLQNLIANGRVERLAFAPGAPAAQASAPARNAEDDPYFSDGLRVVFFLPESGRVPVDPVFLPWTTLDAIAQGVDASAQ
jgi:hypothetical protein